MELNLHANATTTPKIRVYIQRSMRPVAELAAELGVGETTIRRWRGRVIPVHLRKLLHSIRARACRPRSAAIHSEHERPVSGTWKAATSRSNIATRTMWSGASDSKVRERCALFHLSSGGQ